MFAYVAKAETKWGFICSLVFFFCKASFHPLAQTRFHMNYIIVIKKKVYNEAATIQKKLLYKYLSIFA
jgi:hypothetical protein